MVHGAMTDFRQNAMFRPGRDWQMNACVGNNGGPYDLYDYAHGFFEAARVIIKRANDRDAAVDTLVYPACFNFRHGIELYVKYGIKAVAELTGNGARYRTNHSILDNWKAFRDTANRELGFKPEDVRLVDEIVACFSDVDPNGQIFRYPESIKGERHLEDWHTINLTYVGIALDRIVAIFTEWRFQIQGALAYNAQDESDDGLQDFEPVMWE